MREVLAEMLAFPYLHNEKQIRDLVKTGPWIEPLPISKPVEHASKTEVKTKTKLRNKTNAQTLS